MQGLFEATTFEKNALIVSWWLAGSWEIDEGGGFGDSPTPGLRWACSFGGAKRTQTPGEINSPGRDRSVFRRPIRREWKIFPDNGQFV